MTTRLEDMESRLDILEKEHAALLEMVTQLLQLEAERRSPSAFGKKQRASA
jgi:hypothetical protein